MLPYLIKSKLEAKVDKSFMSSLVKVCGRGSVAMSRGTHASQKKSSSGGATVAEPVATATNFNVNGKITDIKQDRKLKSDLESWMISAEANVKEKPTQQALDNRGIAKAVRQDVLSGSKVIAVRGNGELQAAATIGYRRDHLYIEFLATNPKNIPLPGRPPAVKGAGKAAIASTVQASINAGYGGKVKLEALPGAVSFYEKIGFTKDKNTSAPLPSMTLSKEKAQSFLSSYRRVAASQTKTQPLNEMSRQLAERLTR